MDRLRVLLLTLPIPEPPFEIQRGNHQLFALFFKNFLRLRGEDRFEILTLPRRIVDLGDNRAIVDAIFEREPEVAGFSLYLWNVERSIECSRMLKRADKAPITVGGGPEVQEDNDFLLGRDAFDFLVKGEGEDTFLSLLDFLIGRVGPSPVGVPGVGRSPLDYSRAGISAKETARVDADRSLRGIAGDGRLMELPSLYVRSGLLQDCGAGGARYLPTTGKGKHLAVEAVQRGITDIYDEHEEDDFAYLELARGCPYACDFCSYAKNREDVSRMPIPLALESVRALLKRNVGEIYLLAPTINDDRRYFKALLEGIGALRREFPGCRTTLFSELRVELLADGDVDDMIDAGFVEFEIGVQTLRDEGILDKAAGLLARGAKPVIDFILGLPGEDYARCIRTVEAVDGKGLLPHAVFYHLLVLPGSALRKNALEKGYTFSSHPPYQVLRTDRMDLEDIRTVYLYLEHRKDHSYFAEPLYTEPDIVHTVRRARDAESLRASRSLKTGCIVVSETPAEFGPIVDRLCAYAREAPELFHHAFVLWDFDSGEDGPGADSADDPYEKGESKGSGCRASPGGFQALLGGMRTLLRGFKESGNYFDRYCASLDYLDNESFSKRATVLLNPFSGETGRARELLDEGGVDYAFGVRTSAVAAGAAGGGTEARDRLALLQREWREQGVYTVFLEGQAGVSGGGASGCGTAEGAVGTVAAPSGDGTAGARQYLEREFGRPPRDAEGFLYYILNISEG